MADLASDSLSQPVASYEDVADLYELCGCRKEQTMRICRSHEALRRQRQNEEETAAQFLRNQQFYYELLEQVASHLGPDVFVSDDGSIQDSPLMLKVPDLVLSLKKRVAELEKLHG